MLSFDDIEHLLKERGGEQYSGEPVTQLQHALQTTALGEAEGASDELATAALLHDLGETPSLRGVDDVPQYRALPFLRSLSPDSKRSLLLQGGIYTAEEATRFMAQPGAEGAVKLRLWDDLAKDASRITPPLTHFLARAQRCALSPSRPAVAV